jgi:hypothetical protein
VTMAVKFFFFFFSILGFELRVLCLLGRCSWLLNPKSWEKLGMYVSVVDVGGVM